MNNINENFNFKESKSNLKISFERIAFIFFIFFIISAIFSTKPLYLGLKKKHKLLMLKKKKSLEHL